MQILLRFVEYLAYMYICIITNYTIYTYTAFFSRLYHYNTNIIFGDSLLLQLGCCFRTHNKKLIYA